MLQKDTKFNLILMLAVPMVTGLLAFFGPHIFEMKKQTKVKQNQQIQLSARSVSADTSKPESKNAELKILDEEFKSWLSTEVKNLEVPIKDPISSEQNTKNFVNQLSENQINELKNKITNSELPINERIFSNYALTLHTGPDANQILSGLINTKMPDFKNVQTHSEDEVRRGQEYALKYMQIDRLSARAEDGDNSAKELLSQIAQNHSDLKIRNYAQRKLTEIRK